MGKVIRFVRPKKNTSAPDYTKETAHILIDQCKGDFAVVFETKGIEHVLEGEVKSKFVVAVSNVKRIDSTESNHFFKGFASSRRYLDLDA